MRPDDPRLVGHPMLAKDNWKSRAVPLLLHGDGVSFTTGGSNLLAISFGFLLSTCGWSEMSIFLITAVCKAARCYSKVHGPGVDTVDMLWAYIVLGFNALFKGRHATHDPWGHDWPAGPQADNAGKPIADGIFFGVVWALPQDHEYAVNECGCQHWNCNKFCTWCNCEKKDMDNFSNPEIEKVKNNHISTPPSNHPIWSIAGVTRSMYTGDLMHSGDLGPCLHLHGSTMSDLISDTGPYVGAGPAEFRVQRLKVDVDSAYATCGIKKRINTLTQKMIKGKRGPILKAKASEARNLLGPMAQLLTELDDGSEKRGHQLLAYSSLFKMYQVIIQSGLFLSTSEFELVFQHLKQFLLHYKWLHVHCAHSGLYNIVPKFHYLIHIIWFGQWLSPRATWCYAFEDFVGVLKKSAVACATGTPAYMIPRKLMQNYMLALSVRLKDKPARL